MSKSISPTKNKGQSLFGGDSGRTVSRSDQFFIGVVDHVVDKESNNLVKYTNDDELGKYLDDRYAVYVVPIDNNDDLTINKCYFLNTHNIDIPISGEAVLVMKSTVGNLIIDRFSPNAFGINYELFDYLLNDNMVNGNISIEIPNEVRKAIGIGGTQQVKPFDLKLNSKAFLGRNNQYIIFDYGSRKGGDAEEEEYGSDGSYLRFGIKDSEEEKIGKEDPVSILLANNVKIQSIVGGNIESEFNKDSKYEPDNGIGIEGDELVFFGRQFVVIYSEDMLLCGDNLYLDFEEVTVKSEKIKLGSKNAKNPNVLGNELVDMVSELIGIMKNTKHLTPSGPSTGPTPDTILKLEKFKIKYLNKNSSPIHSNKVFLD